MGTPEKISSIPLAILFEAVVFIVSSISFENGSELFCMDVDEDFLLEDSVLERNVLLLIMSESLLTVLKIFSTRSVELFPVAVFSSVFSFLLSLLAPLDDKRDSRFFLAFLLLSFVVEIAVAELSKVLSLLLLSLGDRTILSSAFVLKGA